MRVSRPALVWGTATLVFSATMPFAQAATRSGADSLRADIAHDGGFLGVSASSTMDAWGVGSTKGKDGLIHTLARRWDGHRWTTFSTPRPSGPPSRLSVLYDVTAISSRAAWSVGEYYPVGSEQHSLSLIEHWNGRQWEQIPSPSPNTGVNRFMTVDAVSDRRVWAIGYDCDIDGGDCQPLVRYFNGRRWATPNARISDTIQAVDGSGAHDVWLAGSVMNGATKLAVVKRFDGHSWRRVYLSASQGSRLRCIDWLADDDVWAGGYGLEQGSIVHWNGTTWVEYDPGHGVYQVRSISGTSSSDIWAIADSTSEGQILLHWDGISWVSASFPGDDKQPDLDGLTAAHAANTWAVGLTLSGPPQALTLRWVDGAWVNYKRH